MTTPQEHQILILRMMVADMQDSLDFANLQLKEKKDKLLTDKTYWDFYDDIPRLEASIPHYENILAVIKLELKTLVGEF